MRRFVMFIAGLVAGGAAGAGASILLSPASGEEMRGDARQRFRDILDESARAAEQRRVALEQELKSLTTSDDQTPEGNTSV
jgi:gas vesicle protein